MDPYSDRSWMNQRKSGKQIGTSPQFRQGVEVFLDFAYNHSECVSEENTIRCPCAKCKNVNYFGRDTVHYHLLISGFVRNYKQCWWAHGQIRGSTITAQEDNPGSSGYRMSEMVHDMAGPDFDVCQRREEVINADAKAFLKLLEEGSEPLSDGCTKHSTLSAVATLLNIKTDHNMSNECFENILNAIKSMLPEGEKLPSNYYRSKKMLKKLGLGYKKIDACVNDCMLYYKENEQRVRCLECGHERYRPNEEGGAAKKKLIPYKILRYFPITPRLQRLYMSSRTAEHMTWHARSPTKDGELSHPADGQAWKEMNLAYPEFASEPRNVRLGLSTDGFNPFGHSATPYSCWPVILTPYNLPPWMCMKQPYLFLSLLIPGPKSPSKNLDIYLRPLIDELKVLWHTGVETWDVSTKSNFNLKAALMWTISDFPAYGMLAGWSTHGKLACSYCMEYTKSFTLSNGWKPCWFDCHRCLLPADHPFRRNREQFRKGKVEKDVAPPQLSGRQIRDRVHKLSFLPFGLNAVSRVIAGFGVSHNWVRKSIFWELPYWSTNLIRHNLDVMYIEKNVFDNVFYTVMGITSKTKDNENAREDMKDICNRTGLNLVRATS